MMRISSMAGIFAVFNGQDSEVRSDRACIFLASGQHLRLLGTEDGAIVHQLPQRTPAADLLLSPQIALYRNNSAHGTAVTV